MGKFTVNINTGPSIELTDELRDYVYKKIEMLEKYIGDAGGPYLCDVELNKITEGQQTGDIYYAEFNLSYEGKLERIAIEAKTLYKAIDKAKDEMKRILRRARSRERDLFRRGSAKIKDFLRGFHR